MERFNDKIILFLPSETIEAAALNQVKKHLVDALPAAVGVAAA